jgi:hypothetical protein
MAAGVWVALIASATSLVVSAFTVWNQRATARAERGSEAKRVLDKYRGALLAAASDPGHRINNIRHDNFLDYLNSPDRAIDAETRAGRISSPLHCARRMGQCLLAPS